MRTLQSVPNGKTTPLVLIHGWGNDSRIFDSIRPLLEQDFTLIALDLPGYGKQPDTFPASIEMLVTQLLPRLPPKAAYLGWSMGGNIAMWLARHHPERVSTLVTIASNPCFVSRDDWPTGMPVAIFEAFQKRLTGGVDKCLQYFAAIQALGDKNQRHVQRKLLEGSNQSRCEASLDNGLQLLQQLDLRKDLQALSQPWLSIVGSNDQLVPAQFGSALPSSNASTWSAKHCGHAPHLSRPEAVASRIGDFLLQYQSRTEPSRSKRAVAQSFGRADEYDDGAELQRQSGQALLERMERPGKNQDLTVMDLGSGSGYFTETLREYCGASTVISLDIADGMLKRARQKGFAAQWVCGDAECLPLADSSIDLVYSNLAIQWCQDLRALAEEFARCLKPGGQAYLSTLGPNTLWQLRAAWRQVDREVHVNRFAPLPTLTTACTDAGLELQCCDIETWTRQVANVRQLARELQQIGAHNVNQGRPKGLAGKSRWRALAEAYQLLVDDDEQLPVTWELGFLVLHKPGEY